MPSFTSRSKRLLALQVLAFVGLAVTFLALSEWLLRTRVSHQEPFAQSVELFWRHQDKELAGAVFGASELARGIIPDDPAFINFAVGGENLRLTRAKVHALFQSGSARHVILSATAQTLMRSWPEKDSRENFYTGGPLPALLLLMEYHRVQLLGYWRAFLVKGSLRAGITFGPNGGQLPTAFDTSVVYAKLSPEQRTIAGIHAAQEHDRPDRFRADDVVAFRVYDELIELMRQRGTEVCLLQMPFAPSFRRAAARSEWMSRRVPEIWAGYAVSRGVRYVDLIDMTDDPEAFYDATHLTEQAGRGYAGAILRACFPDITIVTK